MRALAVTSATRAAALPELPALGDFVPGYEASAVSGIGVPAGTPPAIIEKLHNEIASAKRGERRLLSVVLGAASDAARTTKSERLLNYGFQAFDTVQL